MANLQRHRAHESLNTDTAAVWDVQTTLASGTIVDNSADAINVSGYHTIHLMTDNDIVFSFNGTGSDTLNASNDLYLMGGDTIYSLKIPTGIGDTVYLLLERKGGTSCTVRYVLS